jgi:hypothetical protein
MSDVEGFPKSSTQKLNSASERVVVWFPRWKERLGNSGLHEDAQRAHERAILGYLKWCKENHSPATVASAKAFLEQVEGRWPGGPHRAALRWFFRAAREVVPSRGEVGNLASMEGERTRVETAPPFRYVGRTETAPPFRYVEGNEMGDAVPLRPTERARREPPPCAHDDRGGPRWEQALVAEVRRKGLLWRTESTYREWARRFAAFIRPRSVETAREPEIKAFLSDLAARRVAPATQKQALNALVFLYKHALRIELSDFSDFKRAPARRRIPVVLTRDEVALVFGILDGTKRLMARLAYGSGVRVSELVRLRVQDVDVARRTVTVRSGKGDKDRVTPLPDRLALELEAHIKRLEALHAEDRKNQVPGVWLPEGLERKLRGTGQPGDRGQEWIWQWVFVPSLPKGHPFSHPFASLQGQFLTRTAN